MGPLSAGLTTIDHVGIAVPQLEEALALYVDVYGMALAHREVLEAQGVTAALLDVGDSGSHVELIAPLAPETTVGRFLAAGGPGLHHVAYRVEDVEIALARLVAAGARPVDSVPRAGIRGSRVAFLHPATAAGVLTEIVQPATATPGARP